MLFNNLAAVAQTRFLQADFEALQFAAAVLLSGARFVFKNNFRLLIVRHTPYKHARLTQLLLKTRLFCRKNLLPCPQSRESGLQFAAARHRGKELALRVAAGAPPPPLFFFF